MEDKIETVDVYSGNVSETGFFCMMSKRQTEGYQRKLKWLNARFAEGLTLLRSDQCPYIEGAVKVLLETANELGIRSRVIELNSCQEVRDAAPSAYGVFNVIYDGRLLSYHYLTRKEFLNRSKEQNG